MSPRIARLVKLTIPAAALASPLSISALSRRAREDSVVEYGDGVGDGDRDGEGNKVLFDNLLLLPWLLELAAVSFEMFNVCCKFN